VTHFEHLKSSMAEPGFGVPWAAAVVVLVALFAPATPTTASAQRQTRALSACAPRPRFLMTSAVFSVLLIVF